MDTDYLDYAPRFAQDYFCSNGHDFQITFHAEAEVPVTWVCPTCSNLATPEPDGEVPVAEVKHPTKTHIEQLRGRRTEAELEALLAEALHNLRTTGKAF